MKTLVTATRLLARALAALERPPQVMVSASAVVLTYQDRSLHLGCRG